MGVWKPQPGQCLRGGSSQARKRIPNMAKRKCKSRPSWKRLSRVDWFQKLWDPLRSIAKWPSKVFELPALHGRNWVMRNANLIGKVPRPPLSSRWKRAWRQVSGPAIWDKRSVLVLLHIALPAFAFFIKATRKSPKVARPLWQKLPLEEKIKYKEMARESSRLEDQERAAGGISIRKDRQRMNEAMNKDEKPARLHEEVAILGKEFGILQDDESTRILGHGSYGTVFLVRQLQSCRLFAAKVETVTKALDSEIEILKDLNHQSILPIFQSQVVRQGFSWFVMPWVQDGSLLRGNALRFKSQRSLFAQMMSGLSYIHSKRIVHADLKPGNILVDTNTEHYYISDFGLAVRLPESPMERFDPGPLYSLPYRPPELLRDDYKNVNILCDSWAIALTIIEAAYGKRFFSAQTDFLTLQKIRKYEQEVGSGMRGDLVVRLKKFMDLVDPSLKKALSKLLSIDQTSRAPCKNYINAACFASVET